MNLISFHRLGNYLYRKGWHKTSSLITNVQFLIFNSYVPAKCQIGYDTKFAYGGIGVVIHEKATIGNRVVIGQGVTIGGRSKSNYLPRIGDDVYIGPGARILGDIEIGFGSIIAPNAVVISDVPCRCIVGGVPAKIIKENIDIDFYI